MRAPSLVVALLLVAVAAPRARAEALAGRVVDASGAAVPNAVVTFWPAAAELDPDAPALGEVTADASGAFRTEGAGTPRYASARAAGLAGSPVGVQPPDAVVLRLERAAPLEGRLVEDRGGRPVAGVRVRAWSRGADVPRLAALAATATSDEHGAFRFELAPDEYALAVAQDGWDGATERVRVGLAGTGAARVELRVRAGTTLEGVVADGDGSALAGARVVALANGERTYESFVNGMVVTAPRGAAVTDAHGRFRFAALNPAPTYTVLVDRHGYERAEVTAASSSGRVAALPVRLARAAPVRGRVLRPDGTPYDGAASVLCAEDPALPGTEPGRTLRVADGALPSDAVALPCTLTLSVDGFRPVDAGTLRPNSEGVADAGEIRLDRGLTIAGTVLDRAGAPVAGASVSAGERTGRSAADGTFEVPGFDPLPVEDPASAEVEVTAEKDGWVLVAPVGGVRPGQRDVIVRLVRAAAVVGRVVAGDPPAPLRGAQVEVFRAGRTRLVRATYRDPSGRFRVGGLEADRYTLRIAVPGYLPARLERVDLSRRETTDLGDVRLVRGAPLRGLVLDARTGAPVAQATVRVDPRRNAANERPFEEQWTGETGSDGRFAFDGLEPGRHVLDVRAAGRASAHIDVDAGVALPDVIVRVGPRGAIAGTVRDASGAPCAVCRVIVHADEDLEDAAGAVTDDEGRYVLTGVQPGPQTVIITGPAARDEDTMERDSMSDERLVTRRVDVTADATVRLDIPGRGGVVRAHGTLRWKGRPLAARMTWLAPGASRAAPEVAIDASGADGAFDVALGGPGEYRLLVAHDGDDPEAGTINASLRVTVPPGRDAHIDLEVPGGAIDGRVVTDQASEPVAGAVVMVRRAESGDEFPDGFGVAGEDGTFTVGPLQDGRYELTVRAPPYAVARRERAVAVRGGETASAGTLRVKDGVALRVRVVDELEQPIEEAEVACAVAGALEMGARTDVDGFATLENLPDGPLDLAALADGYAPGFAFGVTGAGGEADPPRIRLARGVALSVRASDADGAPLEGLLVHIAPKGRREIGGLLQERRVSSMLTNAAGRLEVPRLAPGDYDVWVALGDLKARRTVTLGGGATKEVALVPR